MHDYLYILLQIPFFLLCRLKMSDLEMGKSYDLIIIFIEVHMHLINNQVSIYIF